MAGLDKDQRPGADVVIPAVTEQERKISQAKAIMAGMNNGQFREFYLEYFFALKFHTRGRAKVKEVLSTIHNSLRDSQDRLLKDRQNRLLDVLIENRNGYTMLNDSPLWDEAGRQLQARNSSEDVFTMPFLISPGELSGLKMLVRTVVDGDARYIVKGASYAGAQRLDRDQGDLALSELNSLGIRQTFVRAGQEDPVDLFLERWGGPKPSATLAEQ